LKLPVHALFVLGDIFPQMTSHHSHSQKTPPSIETHCLSYIVARNLFISLSWVQNQETKDEDITEESKKSQSCNISPVIVPIRTTMYLLGNLRNVIIFAEFECEIFQGYHFTGGRISHFSIDFWMGSTTVECLYCISYNRMHDCRVNISQLCHMSVDVQLQLVI